MRIAHVITRLILGGAQENTLLSCEGQHAHGHDVTLITGPAVGPEGSLVERAKSCGYRVEIVDEMRRELRPMRDWRVYRTITDRLRALAPDVVHTHSSKGGIIGRWAAHQARVRFVVHTIHGLAFTASTSRFANAGFRVLERKTAPITDRIVCVADAMRDQSLSAGIGLADQYVTIYSGMETAPYLQPRVSREQARAQLGFRDEHVVIGTIARLFYLKGHDDLLELAPRLCARFPNLRFLWIGDGLLRPEFEHRIAQMNLKDRFVLTGLVPPDQIPSLAGAMDILVHPSRREGLPRAVPQAALAGRPVVVYDIDGSREGLVDDQTGFLLPPFDLSMMEDAIVKLMNDPSLRASMGAAGREFALTRFDARVMIQALEKLYEEGVRGRKTWR